MGAKKIKQKYFLRCMSASQKFQKLYYTVLNTLAPKVPTSSNRLFFFKSAAQGSPSLFERTGALIYVLLSTLAA
jgi:hypothetical protein